MIAAAWIFMSIAILASVLLLGDLMKELEYNKKVRKRTKGEWYGLQETTYRDGGNFLRRCS